jgi:bifunctional non-homologous end joining protein LigD
MTPTLTKIAGHQLKFSNLDKPLYPDGFTKSQVIDYYTQIAPTILPHCRDRAITLKRYPNGSTGIFFFEKNCPMHKPAWLKTAHVAGNKKIEGNFHCLLNSTAALAWAANLAALELHVPLAKATSQQRPTHMVFDLDPGPGVTILDCAKLAFHVRDVLDHMNLTCLAKTSGGKGLHLYVPLNTPNVTFDDTKHFSRSLAVLFSNESPDRVTSVMRKSDRPNKIFIDWSQNDEHKTTVCPYSLRAKEIPSVSTPVTWKELEQAMRKSQPDRLTFTAPDVIQRAADRGDLFEALLTLKQKLPHLNDAV